MSKNININITNNQNVTSTITNQNLINNLSGNNTFIVPNRRTVFLLASDPSLAVTSNGENAVITLTPFTGAPNQVFLTNFGLTETSFIISTIDNQLFLGPLTDSNLSPAGIRRTLGCPFPGPNNGNGGGGSLPPNPPTNLIPLQPSQPANNGVLLAIAGTNMRLSLPLGISNPAINSPLYFTENELEFIIAFIL